jgi:peptidoglycan/xylan/chitin deacetylase (PgdA/CDA1 family)
MFLISLLAYGYYSPTAQVFGKVYYQGNHAENTIALTFDDGPNEPYTSQVLDELNQYQVKATFFVIGKNVEKYPDTARRIVAEGHVIGNHSYSHNANHALTEYGMRDMKRAQKVIEDTVGVTPDLYRPPYGKFTPWELWLVKKDSIVPMTWSVSTGELHGMSAVEVARRIVSKTRPGSIILLHDGYGTQHGYGRADKTVTVQAAPLIIQQLQAKGFVFVTVPELLNVPAYGGTAAR